MKLIVGLVIPFRATRNGPHVGFDVVDEVARRRQRLRAALPNALMARLRD